MSKAFGKDYGDKSPLYPPTSLLLATSLLKTPLFYRWHVNISTRVGLYRLMLFFTSSSQRFNMCANLEERHLCKVLLTHYRLTRKRISLTVAVQPFQNLLLLGTVSFTRPLHFLNRENETSYSIGLRVGGQLTARTLADDNTVLLRGIIVKDFYLGPVRLMTRRCSNCTDMEVTVVIKEIEDIANHVRVCHAIPLRTGPGKPIVCDHHLLKRECACP
ncbi:hypothetical protein BC829DRAFT_378903 [Chytridium lagenaria]|nr:hypothetical protein BC829DRAFT_378903 [Chytridium lagenaria]